MTLQLYVTWSGVQKSRTVDQQDNPYTDVLFVSSKRKQRFYKALLCKHLHSFDCSFTISRSYSGAGVNRRKRILLFWENQGKKYFEINYPFLEKQLNCFLPFTPASSYQKNSGFYFNFAVHTFTIVRSACYDSARVN